MHIILNSLRIYIYTYIWLLIICNYKYESFPEKSGGNFGKKGCEKSIDRRAKGLEPTLEARERYPRPDEKWWWRKMDISAASYLALTVIFFHYNLHPYNQVFNHLEWLKDVETLGDFTIWTGPPRCLFVLTSRHGLVSGDNRWTATHGSRFAAENWAVQFGNFHTNSGSKSNKNEAGSIFFHWANK